MRTIKPNSFEDKLVDLQNNMLNFALTLTTNREEAKDLLQETTLRALDNKEKYYENVNFKGWVFTIMHNIFVNNYRRIVRIQTMVDQTENLYHLNLPQDSGFDTPEGAYTVAEINKAINSFSDEYKTPFSMHVAGFKYEEIAQKLELPIGTVKSRIFFARKRLQEMLNDYKYQDRG
ncbi:RNA polymerase sigma factor [Viscerimonas tarda]